SRKRGRVCRDFRGRTSRYQMPAGLAGARAEVNYVIGTANRLLVMLNNQDGISQIAQSFQSGKQTIVIARMQADGRLVEHVEHAPEARSDLRGQPNALRLAS